MSKDDINKYSHQVDLDAKLLCLSADNAKRQALHQEAVLAAELSGVQYKHSDTLFKDMKRGLTLMLKAHEIRSPELPPGDDEV